MINETVSLSVVIPVYGCQDTLAPLLARLTNTLHGLFAHYDIILVEDGCPSSSWGEITNLALEYPTVKGIKLSRNFGQHAAITAGLQHAMGDWVVVMDCDLQDQPEEIPRLYKKVQEGFDIVFASRYEQQDSFLKKISSKIFYSVLGYLTDTKLNASIANFGIYDIKVIRAVLQMKENLRYFPVMVRWVGFHSTSIKVNHSQRNSGNTSYSIKKLLSLSLGVMTSFSDKPLYIIVKIGCTVSFFSAISAFVTFTKALLGNYSVAGWSSVMVSLWFIGGVIMAMTSVVGIYVGKSSTRLNVVHITSLTVKLTSQNKFRFDPITIQHSPMGFQVLGY